MKTILSMPMKSKISYYKCILRIKLRTFSQKPFVEKLILCYKILTDDHKTHRRLNAIIRYHYEESAEEYVMSFFRDVKAKETENLLSVRITTKSPGLFIGKQGEDYDRFKQALAETFKKEVKIHIIEAKHW